MQGDSAVSWLMFFTLAATAVIIGGSFAYFIRERTNRKIAAHAIQGDGSGQGAAPSGAGPELIGFAVIAVALMGLLAIGYHGKPRNETAQSTTLVGGTTTGMAQPVGTPNQPQKYQPANPAPDTRAAPTGSDTGTGSNNGGTNTDSVPK